MKKVLSFLKKNWITTWFVIAIAVSVTFLAFAEYIQVQNRAKRVIANTADTGKLFTSDYLKSGELVARELPFGKYATECEIPIRIWNYDSSDPTKHYSTSDISYMVVAQLVSEDGAIITAANALSGIQIGIKKETENSFTYFGSTPASSETVTVNAGEEDEYHYTRTPSYDSTDGYKITYEGLILSKEDKDENTYTLSFPTSMITSEDKIYVKITATPVPTANNSFRDIDPLGAILSVAEQKATLTQGWAGDFYDATANTDYDGFNYVISGNGSSVLKFSWRTDKLEVNKFFLEDNAADIETGYPKDEIIDGVTWRTIYINANSNDTTHEENGATIVDRNGVSRYDIQMYITGNSETDYSSWATINSYVSFDPNATIPTE